MSKLSSHPNIERQDASISYNKRPNNRFEVIGKVKLSNSRKNLVIYVNSEPIGFVGKNVLLDVIHQKFDYARIHSTKTEPTKEDNSTEQQKEGEQH